MDVDFVAEASTELRKANDLAGAAERTVNSQADGK